MSTDTTAHTDLTGPRQRVPVAALAVAPVVSYADRFGYLPVTTAIATQARVPAAAVAASVTAYLVAYGLCQPAWGALSDRVGRRRVLLAGLIGLAVVDLATILLPGAAGLVGLRAAAGAMSGALLPTTLAAVGDLVAPDHRHRVVSGLVAWASVGGAAAMLGAGVLAATAGWRAGLGLLAAAAATGAVIARLALPGHHPQPQPEHGAVGELWRVRRAAARLYAFAFAEGIVMLGAFPLIVPALRAGGQTAAGTGATMAAYGLAAVAGSRLVARLQAADPTRPVLAGGVLLVAGLAAAVALPAAPLTLAALSSGALGAAFSLFHARFQVMATQLAPQARGIGTGLFVGMVFTGAAAGTAATTTLAAHTSYPTAFAATTALATLVATAGHRLAATSPE
jgi:predicted MFS family arabinose efflux permease